MNQKPRWKPDFCVICGKFVTLGRTAVVAEGVIVCDDCARVKRDGLYGPVIAIDKTEVKRLIKEKRNK